MTPTQFFALIMWLVAAIIMACILPSPLGAVLAILYFVSVGGYLWWLKTGRW